MPSPPKNRPATGATSHPVAPEPNPGLTTLRRYSAGKGTMTARPDLIRLSSNESAFGPSPAAVEAYRAVAGALHRYADPTQSALREAIAEVHGLDAERIVCGNGSDELIDLVIRAFIRPGDRLVLSRNFFEMCWIHGITQGAEITLAPETEFRVSVDAILRKAAKGARMVIIANPNNPAGTYMNASELARLHRELPPDVLLVIDGAYAEYVMKDDFDGGLNLVAKSDNVVLTRTFSKIYGLAALRIGWAYCPPGVVDILERIRSPFNANAAAQAAAAAAVRDESYIEKIRRHNVQWLDRMHGVLKELNLFVVSSVANFYLARFDAAPGRTAADAAAFLESRGILTRSLPAGEVGNMLRITVGLDHENETVSEALHILMSRPSFS